MRETGEYWWVRHRKSGIMCIAEHLSAEIVTRAMDGDGDEPEGFWLFVGDSTDVSEQEFAIDYERVGRVAPPWSVSASAPALHQPHVEGGDRAGVTG